MILTKKECMIIDYCSPYLDQMWAASIVAIILNCDFKDVKYELEKVEIPTFETDQY